MVISSFQADIAWTCEIIKKKNTNEDFWNCYAYENIKSLSVYWGKLNLYLVGKKQFAFGMPRKEESFCYCCAM